SLRRIPPCAALAARSTDSPLVVRMRVDYIRTCVLPCRTHSLGCVFFTTEGEWRLVATGLDHVHLLSLARRQILRRSRRRAMRSRAPPAMIDARPNSRPRPLLPPVRGKDCAAIVVVVTMPPSVVTEDGTVVVVEAVVPSVTIVVDVCGTVV